MEETVERCRADCQWQRLLHVVGQVSARAWSPPHKGAKGSSPKSGKSGAALPAEGRFFRRQLLSLETEQPKRLPVSEKSSVARLSENCGDTGATDPSPSQTLLAACLFPKRVAIHTESLELTGIPSG